MVGAALLLALAGIQPDALDKHFGPGSASAAPKPDAPAGIVGSAAHTIGVVPAASQTFLLRNVISPGPADLSVSYLAANLTPLAGDWNGDGIDTPGRYNPATSTFYLRNANTSGPAEITFTYGPGGAGYKPVVGDWDGDGDETVGLYNPATGRFHLRNANSGGATNITFTFGPARPTITPVAGDWNGDGVDTIGLYDTGTGTFYLRNANSGGPAHLTFRFGNGGGKPLAGDWNGDGVYTIGFYAPAMATFFLRDQNSAGPATYTVVYGPANGQPVTGDWDGASAASDTSPPAVALTSPTSGQVVAGTVGLQATASDNIAVAGVRFRVDGTAVGAEETAAPYTASLDTRTLGNGTHTLTAVARDAAGNHTTSAAVTVTVRNTSSDTAPPTVAITEPSSNQTVSGTVGVEAQASDSGGVAGVQFRINGGALGAEETAAPYTASLDTRTLGNGNHTLTAVARDAAGNQSTSTPVVLTVNNGSNTPPPPSGNAFYVAPNGSPSGDGSQARPWDLQTALNQPSRVAAGATIWLRGGTYRGQFRSRLTGTAAAPITVRQYPGETAVIDGNWSTSLTRAITASQASLPVNSTSNIQPGDSLAIGDEIVAVANNATMNGGVIAPVVRGHRGSSATSHGSGATVRVRDDTLTIEGAYTYYWGFEVTNSNPERTIDEPGSSPVRLRGTGVGASGPGVKLINLVIHDTGQGVGLWERATNGEVYGCIIYNNGWDAPDRGHGHGIYSQNETGTKRVRDNVVFGNFGGYAVHVYGSETAPLQGYEFAGNTIFNNEFLVGGEGPAGRITIAENFLYKRGLRLGLESDRNEDATVRDNYVYAAIPLSAEWWRRLTVTNNRFYGLPGNGNNVSLRLRQGGQTSDHTFTSNDYVSGRPQSDRTFAVYAGNGARSNYSFNEWRQLGFDVNGTFLSGPSQGTRPTGVDVFVRPNAYEPGRAHIVVFNWELEDEVRVDVGHVLRPGMRFEVRNAHDYFDGPVLSGTYDGTPLRLPMRNLSVARRLGTNDSVPSTGPEFATFILIPR